MEFSLPLPLPLAKEGILWRQWTNFSHRFQLHKNSTLSHDPLSKVTSMLLHAAFDDVNTICESLKLFDVDLLKLNKLLEMIEQVCLPRFLMLFERFRYFTLEQEASESLNDFINTLRKQVDLCEFGKIKDSIMMGTLLNGVNSESFKQSLQNSDGLCFNDVLSMCSKSAASDNRMSFSDALDSIASSTQKEFKKKTKPIEQQESMSSMYMVPLFDDINEDVDEDEHVNSVVSVSRRKKTHTNKKRSSFASSDSRPKLFLCFACDNEYASRKSVRKHIVAKHADCKEFLCKHCNVSFKSRTDCITHCKGHSATVVTAKQASNWKDVANNEYLCWYCDITFPTLPDYKKHSLTHSAVRVYTCELCQRKNHTIIRMIGHLKGHFKSRHKCEICANSFGRPELLQAHMETHLAQPLHQCQICAKSFVSADRLQGHMKTHLGEKRFTCELCGRSFSQKVSFDYHKRWHAGEKPYECDICGKKTRCFGDLRKHKRMHSDKRPYVCEVCGKSFRFISSLNRHRRGHSGKRSYECDVCGRTFIYGEGLRDHIKASRCPGRKNGEHKSTPRPRRPKAPNPPNPPQHMDGYCNPINYTTSHHSAPPMAHDFPPMWQYMLRGEADGTGGVLMAPQFD